MSRAIVPIANLQRRIPEAGRIRFGVKTAKAMKAIDNFRFTSHDEEALNQIAGLYGGTVRPWSDPKAAAGQFELLTDAPEIRIVLPPDPLGGTPIYETWGGGGCERRCDGLTCTKLIAGPEGPEPVEIDCPCNAEGAMKCDPRTRLSVMLAGVRFGGTWRLETKSWNAAQEMPGMVELIQSLQERGLTRGLLALKHRRSVVAGQTHLFIVPVLGVEDSLEAIAAGAAQVGALPSVAPVAEIGSGERVPASAPHLTQPEEPVASPDPAPDLDDEIVDAEIVEDDDDGEDLVALAIIAGVPLGKALIEARKIAKRLGVEAPTELADVKGTAVGRELAQWFRAQMPATANREPQPEDHTQPEVEGPAPISDTTRKRLFATFGEVVGGNDADQKAKMLGLAWILGETNLKSRTEITEELAQEMLMALDGMRQTGHEIVHQANGSWTITAVPVSTAAKAAARKRAATPAADETHDEETF